MQKLPACPMHAHTHTQHSKVENLQMYMYMYVLQESKTVYVSEHTCKHALNLITTCTCTCMQKLPACPMHVHTHTHAHNIQKWKIHKCARTCTCTHVTFPPFTIPYTMESYQLHDIVHVGYKEILQAVSLELQRDHQSLHSHRKDHSTLNEGKMNK